VIKNSANELDFDQIKANITSLIKKHKITRWM
jgi:hypothetical protein